jgi:hypothetical protein
MRILDQWHKAWMVLVLFLCCLVPFAGVNGAAEEEQSGVAELLTVKACEGVTVTQCEVAKNLINTLKMGEDLTCGACFNHLQALGIAPGADWSYEDPHKVITQKEMKELVIEVQMAYNNGTVRFDGLEAAAGINDFCRDMKGPAPAAGVEPPQGVNTEGGTPTTPTQGPGMEEETSE